MVGLEILKLLLFLTLRTAYTAIQYMWWWLNGTYTELSRVERPECYHESTQVLDIWFRYRFDKVISRPSSSDYITTHRGFVDPDLVLRDNITLYELTPLKAVFIESPENINVYHSSVASFVKEGQFNHGQRLYVMPITSFYKLAEKVGRPQAPIILLGNTSRCGSTLLTQLMDSTDEIVSMSEPAAFEAVTFACQDKLFSDEHLDRYIVSGISMLCKPMPRKPCAYFIKMSGAAMIHMEKVRDLFPDTKLLFMYREGLEVAVSLVKISYKLPILRIIFTLGRFHRIFTRTFFEAATGAPGKEFDFRIKHQVLYTLMIWVIMCKKYLNLRQEGYPLSAIKFEDLISDPKYTLQELFKYCELPQMYVEKALRGMDADSQRHSVLSKDNLINCARGLTLPSNLLAEAQAFCDKHGVPRVPDTCVLEGTISHR